VVVGASAGSVESLRELVAGLPGNLPVPVLVVLHVPPLRSNLPKILQRAGPLPASHAEDGQALEAGHILVAPPDRHLMVEDGRVRVVRGPREHLHRPAIDPLFRTAATAYGPGAIAVVLSGARTDGAAGAAAVSECGGAVLVQDPEVAAYPDMPRSAITADHADYVLPLAEIPATISRLAMGPVKEVPMADPDTLNEENRYAALDHDALQYEEGIGKRAPFCLPRVWRCALGAGGRRAAALPVRRARVRRLDPPGGTDPESRHRALRRAACARRAGDAGETCARAAERKGQ
jgi:two-component system, chemotaxis family, protein-glutamate methylesterase/glutaminase